MTAGGPGPASARLPLALTILLWSLNIPALKWLAPQFDTVEMAAVRMAAAAAVLAALLRLRGPWPRVGARRWVQLAACALLMVVLNQQLFIAGIARSSATNAALISATTPVMAALLALALLREPVTGRRLVGVLLALAGVALVILKQPGAALSGAGLGDLQILLAVLFFASGAVLIQRLGSTLDALTISAAVHAIGAACLFVQAGLAVALSGHGPRLDAPAGAWAMLLLSGALATGLGNLLWSRSITLVGIARASLWLYGLPLCGIASSMLFLGEPLTVWHAAGLALVLAGTRLADGMAKTR